MELNCRVDKQSEKTCRVKLYKLEETEVNIFRLYRKEKKLNRGTSKFMHANDNTNLHKVEWKKKIIRAEKENQRKKKKKKNMYL